MSREPAARRSRLRWCRRIRYSKAGRGGEQAESEGAARQYSAEAGPEGRGGNESLISRQSRLLKKLINWQADPPDANSWNMAT